MFVLFFFIVSIEVVLVPVPNKNTNQPNSVYCVRVPVLLSRGSMCSCHIPTPHSKNEIPIVVQLCLDVDFFLLVQ